MTTVAERSDEVMSCCTANSAGVDFISLNIGMCMNPLSQISPVIDHFTAAIAATPGLKLVSTVDDLEPGVTGVAFDLEGARPLQGRAEAVATFHAQGVRMMHLAYNRNNEVAGVATTHPWG